MELAAALLVIGAATDIPIGFQGLAIATGEARLFFAASLALAVGLIALGVLVRQGRAWLVAVNVVAIAAFLELRAVTAAGVISAVLDMLVVGLLLRHRWWFRWSVPAMPAPAPSAPTGAAGEPGGRRDAEG